MPTPFLLILLAIGFVLILRNARKLGSALVVISLVSFYAFSVRPLAHLIASPLEFQYPKYSGQKVEYVVVLGSGHVSDERIPTVSQLKTVGLARLTTGIEIYKQNPGAKLLLSGYGGYDQRSHAEVSAEVAQVFGVPKDDILLAPDAKTTREEALAWQILLHDQPFALATSAMHMPRAMYLFQSVGLTPIAAPANFETAGHRASYWRDWMPSASKLLIVEAAWHEYLGLAWAKLGQLLNKEA